MGYAYTPGLTVADCATERRIRRLPVPGRVLVAVGQAVSATDVVAETELPGESRVIDAADRLGIAPEELPLSMIRSVGDGVAAGDLLARTRGWFGRFRHELISPMNGTVESISPVTGRLVLRGPPTLLRRTAYARGQIVAVAPGESATVEIRGAFVQGIFGVGGEAEGTLALAVDSADATLEQQCIGPACAGRILIGGRLVTADAIRAAVANGAKAIVTGGLNDSDLRDLLGYDLGVAITGDEALGLTLIVTEGFGPVPMARRTFELLRRHVGRQASVNGATQIRAGVIRPEVLIPLDETPGATPAERTWRPALELGTIVRAIREPHFGRIGRCVALPTEPVALPTEAQVRVVTVEFENGERAVLPRANVELIKA